jgi:hypothetical protein
MDVHSQIKATFGVFCTQKKYNTFRNTWISTKLLVAILNRMPKEYSITITPGNFNQMVSSDKGFPADDFSKTNSTGVFRKNNGRRTVYFITKKGERPEQPDEVNGKWIDSIEETSQRIMQTNPWLAAPLLPAAVDRTPLNPSSSTTTAPVSSTVAASTNVETTATTTTAANNNTTTTLMPDPTKPPLSFLRGKDVECLLLPALTILFLKGYARLQYKSIHLYTLKEL